VGRRIQSSQSTEKGANVVVLVTLCFFVSDCEFYSLFTPYLIFCSSVISVGHKLHLINCLVSQWSVNMIIVHTTGTCS